MKNNYQTIYEIDLKSLIHNLNFFKSKINYKTKIMIMVKAFSYGNGLSKISKILEQNNVDYLGVAYIQEGINIRNKGIKLPILVMNPNIYFFKELIKYNLEPEIYNFNILKNFIKKLKNIKYCGIYPIHIKIDTGMSRLGFSKENIISLSNIINNCKRIFVKSIFSHLATSEKKEDKIFTLNQINLFNKIYNQLSFFLKYFPIKHILNTAGIIFFPEAQFDMVRIGLGIYGIFYDKKIQKNLKIVGVLKTIISQIKIIKTGDSVGYGRHFIANKTTKIATIPIGYADGLDRRLGYNKGYVMIKNLKSKIIGSICMDMAMININNIKCNEGDEVIIFGICPTVNELAKFCNTIPYEILTSISNRVKRIYIE